MSVINAKPNFNDNDAETVAKSFKTAMKGVGTDETRIIREITSLSNDQRQQVKSKYKAMYGNTLEEDLKSELKGDFENIIISLLTPRFDFEAKCLREALHGAGTNEHVIIELLCSKEPGEIEKIKESYKRLYNDELESDIKSDENGPLGKLFRSLSTGNRPTLSTADSDLAKKEAQELYDAGEGKFGTDESELVRILASRSFAQLRKTFDEYQKIGGKNIEDAIKSETSGDFEEALIAIIQSIRNKPAYFARQIHRTVKGTGTKEHDLVRILVTRSEIDMVQIKQEYKNLYHKSLFNEMKDELRGDFEEIVLRLVGKD